MRKLKLILIIITTSILQHCGGGGSGSGAIMTEDELSSGAYLESFSKPILLHLESSRPKAPVTTISSNRSDTAEPGVDRITYKISTKETREFCLEGFEDIGHKVYLLDSSGNILLSLSKDTPCKSLSILPGDYAMEYTHDGLSKETAIFVAGSEATVKALSPSTIISTRACKACDLRNMDLSYYDFTEVDFTGADLSRSDLSNSILYEAKLTGAKLQGTKLGSTMWTDGFLCTENSVSSCEQTNNQIQIAGIPFDGVTPSKFVCILGDTADADGSLQVPLMINSILATGRVLPGMTLPFYIFDLKNLITVTREQAVTTVKRDGAESFCAKGFLLLFYEKYNCTSPTSTDLGLAISVPIYTDKNITSTTANQPIQKANQEGPSKMQVGAVSCAGLTQGFLDSLP